MYGNNIANAVDKQFAEVGQQQASPNGESPFSTLSNGVQIKDFRVGSGATVQQGSKVVSYIFDVYDVITFLHRIEMMPYEKSSAYNIRICISASNAYQVQD